MSVFLHISTVCGAQCCDRFFDCDVRTLKRQYLELETVGGVIIEITLFIVKDEFNLSWLAGLDVFWNWQDSPELLQRLFIVSQIIALLPEHRSLDGFLVKKKKPFKTI